MIWHGEHGEYRWVQVSSTPRGLATLISKMHPHLRLAIVAFDSGPIAPSADEQHDGWCVVGPSMVSPPLEERLEIPEAGHDEWYLLEKLPDPRWTPETFVNYVAFTLREPHQIVANQDPTSDRHGWDWLEPVQQRFWEQLEKFKPITYVASGDHLVVVSRRPEVLAAVEGAAQTPVSFGGSRSRGL